MFIGHTIILLLALSKNMGFLLASLLWIATSRLCISCMLFIHARRMDMSFPFLIYINQLVSTVIKIYILFRLPQQRWKNRGDQNAGFNTARGWKLRGYVANYLTLFYCVSCFLVILLTLHLAALPTMSDIKNLF